MQRQLAAGTENNRKPPGRTRVDGASSRAARRTGRCRQLLGRARHGRARGWTDRPRARKDNSPSWATDRAFRGQGRQQLGRARAMDEPDESWLDSRVARRERRRPPSSRNGNNSGEMRWGRSSDLRDPDLPRQRGETVASTRRQGSHQRLPSSRAGARYSARANANEFSPADREGAQFRGRGMRPGWLAWTGSKMGGRQRYLHDHHGG